jgi:hypothetical protein
MVNPNSDVVHIEVSGHKFSINNTVPYFCCSDLRDTDGDGVDDSDFPDDKTKHRFLGAVDTLESIVLAHCRAGVNVTSTEYKAGLETTIEAIMNNIL